MSTIQLSNTHAPQRNATTDLWFNAQPLPAYGESTVPEATTDAVFAPAAGTYLIPLDPRGRSAGQTKEWKGSLAAVGYADGSVRFYDANTSEQLALLKQGTDKIERLEFAGPTELRQTSRTSPGWQVAHTFDLSNLSERRVLERREISVRVVGGSLDDVADIHEAPRRNPFSDQISSPARETDASSSQATYGLVALRALPKP